MASSPDTPRLSQPQVAILSALSIELAGLKSRYSFGNATLGNGFRTWQTIVADQPVLIVETGVGYRRAEKATQAIIDAYRPNWVISVGLCGGLNEELLTGQLVIAKSVKRLAGRAIACSKGILKDEVVEKIEAKQVQAITAESAVLSVEGKKKLHDSTKGDIVDLESFAVVDVCQQRQVKFGVLRVISDDAKTSLPPGVMSLIGETGALRVGALVGTLWNKPSSVIDLWNLRQQSMACSQTLAIGIETLCQHLRGE